MILLIHEDGTLQQIRHSLTNGELEAIDEGILTAVEVIEGVFREFDGCGDSYDIPIME